MAEAGPMLVLLQHGDSFFPTGAASLSWGTETLSQLGRISDAGSAEMFIRGQIRGRWASFDRPALAAAHRAEADLDRVAHVDELVEAQSLVLEMRQGSKRAGAAMLGVHERLGTAGAAAYAARMRAGKAHGHSSAVQGLLWRVVGMAEEEALLLSAHTFCVGLLGAAIRLGIIGHIDAQRSLARLHREIVAVLATACPDLDSMGAFVPEAEIAVMRHEVSTPRLFAN
ncbi:MAG: urease accessory protein UreF [Pseudomonadota bacterium]